MCYNFYFSSTIWILNRSLHQTCIIYGHKRASSTRKKLNAATTPMHCLDKDEKVS